MQNIRMVPDPGEVLDVVEQASFLPALQLPVQPNLPSLRVVVQVEPRKKLRFRMRISI